LVIEGSRYITAIEIKSSKHVTGRDVRNLREFTIQNTKKKLRKIIFYLGSEFALENDIAITPITSLFQTGHLWK
jgi:hypothetical protein